MSSLIPPSGLSNMSNGYRKVFQWTTTQNTGYFDHIGPGTSKHCWVHLAEQPPSSLGATSAKFLTYYQRWDVYCRCIFSPGLFLLQFGDLRALTHSLSLWLLWDTIPFQQIIRKVWKYACRQELKKMSVQICLHWRNLHLYDYPNDY